MKELECDERTYRRYIRINLVQFEDLLTRVGPLIQRQNTHFRSAISPEERLALTLRFLATGTI